jgi:CubicO group peptidase (beta-lactamase class C family)
MTGLADVGKWLGEYVPAAIGRHDVPGVAWAVLADGEVVDGAAGVLSKATGVEATADSVFQIGSITKLWTGSLVMQLVDEGKLDLDVPIRTYLPEFRIADEDAAGRITTRQLLSHTAGFEGDIPTYVSAFSSSCVSWHRGRVHNDRGEGVLDGGLEIVVSRDCGTSAVPPELAAFRRDRGRHGGGVLRPSGDGVCPAGRAAGGDRAVGRTGAAGAVLPARLVAIALARSRVDDRAADRGGDRSAGRR